MLKLPGKTALPLLFLLLGACQTSSSGLYDDRDLREDMRQFVQGISFYAKGEHPGFIIIPQNGQELVSLDGEADGPPAADYLAAIDGTGREDLFYGYDSDNKATLSDESEYLLDFCRVFLDQGKTVLVTDYCWDTDKVDDALQLNGQEGFLSFPAPRRDLDTIPSYPDPVQGVSSSDIAALDAAANFLYLLDSGNFSSKDQMVMALDATDYDVLIIDLFYEDQMLTSQDVTDLQTKANGGKRLVISYMSIGEAEDYRYYWQDEWEISPPGWLDQENPDWEGNYKVHYWDPDWQAVIYGSSDAYLDRILAAGFDGVYLDIIDGFEYFESL